MSTLVGDITAAATSLAVISAGTFPAVGDFRIKIDSEVLLVTAVSGSTFTVTRGADGTTAATHSNGAVVAHIVTAGSLDQAFRDAFGLVASAGYPTNRIQNGANTLTASSFTWLNQGSATCVDADDGGLILTTPNETGRNIRGKYLTAPSAPWRVTAHVMIGPGMVRFTGAGTGTVVGIVARESSTGKLYAIGIRSDAIWFQKLSDPSTYSSDVDSFLDSEEQELWFQLYDDNTDVRGFVSFDGIHFMEAWNESRTAWLTGGIDQVGFFADSGGGKAGTHCYVKSWILEDL